jgi:hypothetical protein
VSDGGSDIGGAGSGLWVSGGEPSRIARLVTLEPLLAQRIVCWRSTLRLGLECVTQDRRGSCWLWREEHVVAWVAGRPGDVRVWEMTPVCGPLRIGDRPPALRDETALRTGVAFEQATDALRRRRASVGGGERGGDRMSRAPDLRPLRPRQPRLPAAPRRAASRGWSLAHWLAAYVVAGASAFAATAFVMEWMGR